MRRCFNYVQHDDSEAFRLRNSGFFGFAYFGALPLVPPLDNDQKVRAGQNDASLLPDKYERHEHFAGGERGMVPLEMVGEGMVEHDLVRFGYSDKVPEKGGMFS